MRGTIIHRFTRFASVLVLTLVVGSIAFAQSIPREVRLRILEAVVQVRPWDNEAGQLAPWSGSGTIISPDGYILTNFHVIGDLDSRDFFEFHAIYMTDPAFTDQPPEMSYWAQYVDSDPTHDLAVLKIVEFPDETPIPSDLTFTSVEVGDSNDLFPGDTITIVGYPGISGATITFTAGLMSGWLGEDFESGGKQWLKTDAKISHGNSGGGAFNAQGQLIGVPTAGITVQYEELDVEEQAYVRPISLAWAVIGPNVASVNRAFGVGASTQPPASNPNVVASRLGDPSGEYGSIAMGQSVSGTIAGIQGEETVVYHTYVVDVPAGSPAVTISVSGNGADLDLAVKAGGPILNYDEVDHLDTSEDPNPVYVIPSPSAGPVYIDVMNLLSNAADYTLVASSGGNTGTTTSTQPGGGESGDYGEIAIGQPVNGTIAGIQGDENFVWHGYSVNVPAGTVSLTISIDGGGADLDLAVKVGSPITGYDEGEVDHLDTTEDPNPVYVIPNPPAGPVYFDILNLLPSTANYSVQVTTDGSGGSNPLGGNGSNPLGQSGGDNPLGGQAAPINVPSRDSGTVGDIAFGQQANGELTGIEGAASFHAFLLTVPQGIARMTVRMVANEDLDLAVKFGSEIQSYTDDGDWTYRDNSLDPSAEFVIDRPQPGVWYIDVFNGLGPRVTGGYTLIITAE